MQGGGGSVIVGLVGIKWPPLVRRDLHFSHHTPSSEPFWAIFAFDTPEIEFWNTSQIGEIFAIWQVSIVPQPKKSQRPNLFQSNLTSPALLELAELGSVSMLLPFHLAQQHLCNHSHRNPKLWLVRALEQGQPQAFNDRPSIIPRRSSSSPSSSSSSSSSSSWIWHHENCNQFDHDNHRHNIHLDHLYRHHH